MFGEVFGNVFGNVSSQGSPGGRAGSQLQQEPHWLGRPGGLSVQADVTCAQ